MKICRKIQKTNMINQRFTEPVANFLEGVVDSIEMSLWRDDRPREYGLLAGDLCIGAGEGCRRRFSGIKCVSNLTKMKKKGAVHSKTYNMQLALLEKFGQDLSHLGEARKTKVQESRRSLDLMIVEQQFGKFLKSLHLKSYLKSLRGPTYISGSVVDSALTKAIIEFKEKASKLFTSDGPPVRSGNLAAPAPEVEHPTGIPEEDSGSKTSIGAVRSELWKVEREIVELGKASVNTSSKNGKKKLVQRAKLLRLIRVGAGKSFFELSGKHISFLPSILKSVDKSMLSRVIDGIESIQGLSDGDLELLRRKLNL